MKHEALSLAEAARPLPHVGEVNAPHPQAGEGLGERAKAENPEFTPEGFLLNYLDWTEDLALTLAQENNLKLTQDHWEILNFVRAYYLNKKTSPGLRELIKALKPSLGENKANSLYLFKLFPDGAAKQISRLAGLPKPAKCI